MTCVCITPWLLTRNKLVLHQQDIAINIIINLQFSYARLSEEEIPKLNYATQFVVLLEAPMKGSLSLLT